MFVRYFHHFLYIKKSQRGMETMSSKSKLITPNLSQISLQMSRKLTRFGRQVSKSKQTGKNVSFVSVKKSIASTHISIYNNRALFQCKSYALSVTALFYLYLHYAFGGEGRTREIQLILLNLLIYLLPT